MIKGVLSLFLVGFLHYLPTITRVLIVILLLKLIF
jgi:hypothetical protein